ncbi:MAG: hypothetical protein ucyna2_01035 [Candidatus Atelocyanobacterium thalassa isolate SIO64986]|uniref:Uncharacterized protein n=1 Tax=Candidatus Atelocyanobacterium thalassa isolate SIO64986 TaxID=1527444 RepID=A0A086CG14_9CHRO|nr:MAG: hypothetical protein ucyna2_01035 [Candidatus Atelocyanobacterium thalassa isolate SIO64986]
MISLKHRFNLLKACIGSLVINLYIAPLSVYGNVQSSSNQYSVCIKQLKKFSISGEDAATACSDALIPKELSQCVSIIGNIRQIDGSDSLRACFQVRRPIDLGNCVVSIHRILPNQTDINSNVDKNLINSLTLLDSCRSSLNPGLYAECVIATVKEVKDITHIKAMSICLTTESIF